MSEAQDTDLLLVNRNGTSYKQEIETMRDRIDDTDLLVVYRNGQAYKITGEDFIDSTQSFAAPVINNVVLAEDSPGGTRFANQDFNITYNMTDDGEPESSKLVKPYVIGGISLFGETSAITNVGMSSVQLYVWDGTAPTNLADIETNGTPVATGNQANLTASTQYFILVNKGITASLDGEDVFTGNGTTNFSITANVANGGAYDAAGNRLGGSGGYNSSEWTLQKWTSDIATINDGYTFYTGAAYYILDNYSGASSGSSGLPNYNIGSTILTLTNDNELDYFEVGDMVQSYWNQDAMWSSGIQVYYPGDNPANAFDGNSSTYISAELAAGTITWVPPGGSMSYSSSVRIRIPASGAETCYGQLNSQTAVSSAGASPTWTTLATGSGTITSISTYWSATYRGSLWGVEVDGLILVDTGISGAPGAEVTAISPSTPSMGVSGGTWAVGDTVTNTVERQEQVILSTDDITDIEAFIVGTATNTSATWSNSVTYPTSPISGAYGFANMFDGQAPITYGDPYIIWNVPSGQSFSGTVFMTAGIGDATYDAPTLYINGSSTPATQLSKTAANSYLAHYVFEHSGPVTTLKIDSAGSTNTLVASLGIGTEWLLDTGVSTAVDPVICPQIDLGKIFTFVTDDQLDNFQAGWAVKQDAPVTPVTSAITGVVTNNDAGMTPTPEPTYLTQATSGTHSGKGWPEVIGQTPTTTSVDEYWCIFSDGASASGRGTITYTNMTIGQTITLYGFRNYGDESRSVYGDVSESTVTVPGGTFGTSSAPPTFTLTTTATDGSFFIDFNNSYNLFGVTPGPGGNSVDLTFTDDTQLDNFQVDDAVTGPVTGTGVLPPTTVPTNLLDAFGAATGSTLQAQAWAAFTADLTTAYTFVGVTSPVTLYYMTVPYQGTVTVNYTASAVGESFTWGFANSSSPTLTLGGDVSNPGDIVISTSNINSPQQVTITVSKTSGSFTLTAPTDAAATDLYMYDRSAMGTIAITSANVVSTTPASNEMTVDGGTWTNGQTVTGPVIDGAGEVVSTDPSAKTMNLGGSNYAAGAGLVDSTAHPKSYAFDGRMDTYCSPAIETIFRTLFGEEVTINTSFRIYSPNGAGNSLYYKINNGNATQVTTVDGWITIPYTGTTSSIKVASNTGSINVTAIEIDGTVLVDYSRFAIGSKVETADKVPNPEVKMFCVTNALGSISDLSITDPGYTTLATEAVLQTLTFPATFPSGVAADTELPVGTTLAVDVQASNIIATVSATTNVVTPTT